MNLDTFLWGPKIDKHSHCDFGISANVHVSRTEKVGPSGVYGSQTEVYATHLYGDVTIRDGARVCHTLIRGEVEIQGAVYLTRCSIHAKFNDYFRIECPPGYSVSLQDARIMGVGVLYWWRDLP